jgi:hypothetical protein
MIGFITECGNYGVFEFGNKWMVVYRNQQLEVFKTQKKCNEFIEQHKASLKTAPKPTKRSRKSTTIKTK